MNIQQEFERWSLLANQDPDVQQELKNLSYPDDQEAIEDRFFQNLEFGTGGLRGVIGAGTNRMNIYTIRKATQGLANYILAEKFENPSVAIAYDSRIKSDVFAKEAAKVLAANGIKVYIYQQLMPTPSLSYAVRAQNCCAGICVTASHNPAKYNGYKVYGCDGCQITLEAAEKILSCIQKVDPFDDVQMISFEDGLAQNTIQWTPESVIDSFIDAVAACRLTDTPCDNLKLVYTPLNGSGLMCVKRILDRIGVTDITVVPEQEHPDGNFPTCPYPNPEIKEALQKGLELCKTIQPDLLLATDPDCDRVGIAVHHEGDYQLLSGNEVGVLLLDFIAKLRTNLHTMPQNPVAVKTIVTTEMAQRVADHYGIQLRNVLTGFKFIGEQIGLLEKDGEADRYIFGFEESYGYLSGGYVRDKDAVNASMLICEMASYYKQQGLNLVQVLNELYQTYGCYVNHLDTLTYEGVSGTKQMNDIMTRLRTNHPTSIGGLNVVGVMDYLSSQGWLLDEKKTTDLPVSNILEFYLQDNCKVIIRPSGTEPKIKLYFSAQAPTMEQANEIVQKLSKDCATLLN